MWCIILAPLIPSLHLSLALTVLNGFHFRHQLQVTGAPKQSLRDINGMCDFYQAIDEDCHRHASAEC